MSEKSSDSIINFKNEERIVRRIPNSQYKDGEVLSSAFQRKKGHRGVSANLKRLTSYTKAITDPSRYILVELTIEDLTENEFKLSLEYDPIPDNDAHVLIIGLGEKKKSKPERRYLAENCEVIGPW